MDDTKLVFNGINGATGGYLLPEMTSHELSQIAQGESFEEAHLRELQWRYHQASGGRHLGLREGLDPKKLSQAGWAVIFAFDDRERIPGIKEALGELLSYRQEQAGTLYREYDGANAYRSGESKSNFLSRHGVGPGPVVPEKVPYYLLIVASPAAISYRFQYQLDVQYAVGRIFFESLQEYASYARSVVSAEKGEVKLARKAVFFGPQNPDDGATDLSAAELVEPLAEQLAADQPEWSIAAHTFIAEDAIKAQLAQLIGGAETPAFLFTASHGMGFPLGDSRQLPHQGALLCQDWPGPYAWQQPIPHDHYFAAEDIADDATLLGLLSFHFACYGAGTPHMDDFAHAAFKERKEIAPYPFISKLPQRMLGHPRGGALAAVGHVERAWGYSFLWDRAGSQIEVFNSTLKRLLEQHPIGSALEPFNMRYAELSTLLNQELEDISFDKIVDDIELSGMWTANNDARSYVILGDPAVRLPVGDDGDVLPERPTIEVRFESTVISEEAPLPSPEVEAIDTEFVDFGVRETLSETRKKLEMALQHFADQLGNVMAKAVDDASSLEVRTYVSDDLSQVTADVENAAILRAFTRISIDGDTVVCVPEQEGDIDGDLWSIHLDTVKQAQSNRADMLKAAAAAATSLLEALKVV
ncbi:MAG: hypothetical protein GY759_04820 [Chloroflexi bacterium]|nr:hypothetical protein [Chloroflexota bacterium]